MNKKLIAHKYGFSEAYFGGMRNTNPDKYFSIFKNGVGNETEEDIEIYIEEVKKIVQKMETILYMFEDNKGLYGKFLIKNGIGSNTSNYTATYGNDFSVVFKIRDDGDYLAIQYDKIVKWKKIIDAIGFNVK